MTDAAATDRDVLATAREWVEAGVPGVLATLVDVEGRAYRRPGARLAFSSDRGRVGALTAGCAESRLTDLADDLDGPRVETLDLSGDGAAWGFGAGCNGVLTVLLDPLDDHLAPAFDALDEEGTVAAVVSSTDPAFDVGDRVRPADLDGVSAAPEPSGLESVETDGGRVRAFRERLSRPPRLLVAGSGADVRPVTAFAARTRFDVTVAGFRGRHATADRFPDADRVVATSPRSLTDDVTVDGETYAVVMSHNFVDDRLAVEALLDADAPYVGVMGPAERVDAMREAGDVPESDALYAPVGLDVGGETPAEVAQSVVAEALAVHSGRRGGHLDDTDRVHDRPEDYA